MRVNITNTSGKALSTSLGLVDAGATAAFDVSPEKMWRAALELETARAAGHLTYRVSTPSNLVDAFETATVEVAGTRSADVTITSAQMLALNATPQTLVAAPGAGKALILEGLQLFLDYNSAAYADIAAGEDLAVKYTGSGGLQVAQVEATGFLDQTSDQLRWAHAFNAASGDSSFTPVANAPLVLHMLTGEVTTGDSPLKCRVFYRVIPTTL